MRTRLVPVRNEADEYVRRLRIKQFMSLILAWLPGPLTIKTMK